MKDFQKCWGTLRIQFAHTASMHTHPVLKYAFILVLRQKISQGIHIRQERNDTSLISGTQATLQVFEAVM